MENFEPEIHLFILWEKSRYMESRIVEDISRKFNIILKYDITWSKDLVSSNFSRFYGTNLPVNSNKEIECGNGTFLLLVVEDLCPKYNERATSKGPVMVNSNMFDSKTLYRNWTGGGHKIHGTNNVYETRHDLYLLIGKNIDDIIQLKIERGNHSMSLTKDLEGARGWNSLNELFRTLNNTSKYVIIRGKDELLNNKISNEHRDIDILVENYDDVKYIINGQSSCNPHRPHELVHINDIDYYIDLWDVQRLYFDSNWMQNMFYTRVNIDNFFFLNEENYIYCLLYHCLLFKGYIANDYKYCIDRYIYNHKFLKKRNKHHILIEFLHKNNYYISIPKDISITLKKSNICVRNFINKKGIIIKGAKDKYFGNGEIYNLVLEKDKSYIKIGPTELINNELFMLKQLLKYNYFPRIVSHSVKGKISQIEIGRLWGESYNDFFSLPKHMRIKTIESFIRECITILSILHKNQIIHRDFIPQNIIIKEEGNACRVYLIDFGWAIKYDNIDNAKNPITLGAGYHKCVGEYSDYYTVGKLLLEKFGHYNFVRNISNILCNINTKEYIDRDCLYMHISRINKILAKRKSTKDYLYIYMWQYRELLQKHESLYKIRVFIHRILNI